jgi:hypothetical protein
MLSDEFNVGVDYIIHLHSPLYLNPKFSFIKFLTNAYLVMIKIHNLQITFRCVKHVRKSNLQLRLMRLASQR